MRCVLIVVLAAAVGGPGCTAPKAPAPVGTTPCQPVHHLSYLKAVRTVLREQVEAWNRGDLAGFMAAYEEGPMLLFTSGGNVRRGYDETYEKFRARYGKDRSTMGHLTLDLRDIRSLGTDAALVFGKWRLTDTPQAGQGVFSLVFIRTLQGWRIVHDHTTSVPAPAPAAGTE